MAPDDIRIARTNDLLARLDQLESMGYDPTLFFEEQLIRREIRTRVHH